MKNLLLTGLLLSSISLLVGCGGGSDSSAGSTGGTPTPATGVTSTSNSLIIDNGRGTTNNQDTETAQE